MSKRIAGDVTLERDVPVPMSDGVQLMANVFRSFPPEALAGFDVSHALRQRHAARFGGDTAHAPFGSGSAIWTVPRGQGLKRPIRCSG